MNECLFIYICILGGGFILSPADGKTPKDGKEMLYWNFVLVTAVELGGTSIPYCLFFFFNDLFFFYIKDGFPLPPLIVQPRPC